MSEAGKPGLRMPKGELYEFPTKSILPSSNSSFVASGQDMASEGRKIHQLKASILAKYIGPYEDDRQPQERDKNMNDSDRGYVDAKLETAEERMNARLAGIEARIDTGLSKIAADFSSLQADLKILNNMSTLLRDDSKKIDDKLQRVEEQRNAFIYWIIGTSLALFLAILAIVTFGKDMFEWGQIANPSVSLNNLSSTSPPKN